MDETQERKLDSRSLLQGAKRGSTSLPLHYLFGAIPVGPGK
jgi:hypothetical protein